MRMGVVSDIHLGAKDALDRFARTEAAEQNLIATLNDLEREVDRIVLLGDIFETLRGVVPGTRAEELKKGLAAYPEIARRILEDPRYTYIFGNHDYVARDVLRAPEFYSVEVHGRRVLFFHGHQADWISKGEARMSRIALWGSGMLERAGIGVTQWVDHHRVQPAGSRPWPFGRGDAEDRRSPAVARDSTKISAIEAKALSIGRAMGADIVVNGHTHRAIRHDTADQIYLNCGTCLCGRRDVVVLDLAADRYEVRRLNAEPVAEPEPDENLQVA